MALMLVVTYDRPMASGNKRILVLGVGVLLQIDICSYYAIGDKRTFVLIKKNLHTYNQL